MLELQHLEYLVMIAEEGTMSAAAEKLHLSQPALSRSMQRLEESLDLKLFERGKNRIELNAAGLLAVEQARMVLSSAREMQQRMDDYRRSLTTITIGSCAPAPAWLLIPELSSRYPGMTVTSYMKEDGLLEDLKEGRCQYAILNHQPDEPGIVCRPYVKEQLAIMLPKHHPLASHDGLMLTDLDCITMLLFSELGIWQKLHDEKMQNISLQRGKLSTAIGGIKRAISHFANENKIPFAWQPLFHDRIIRDTDELNRIADYINNNVAKWDSENNE